MLTDCAAGSILASRQRGVQAATAYLCAAAVALLAGSGDLATSIQNAALLTAAAAALARRGSLPSAVLLAAGSAAWLPGAVLQAAPLALLAATRQPGSGPDGSGGSRAVSGSACGSASTSAVQASAVARRIAGYMCCFAATAAALAHAQRALPPGLAAAVGLAGGHAAAPAVSPADLAADPLAWVGARVAQQPPHLGSAAVLPAASLEPGLGLQWYLLAQTFPQFRCTRGAAKLQRLALLEGAAGLALRGAAALTQGCVMPTGADPAALPCLHELCRTPARRLQPSGCPPGFPATAQTLSRAAFPSSQPPAGPFSCTSCAGCPRLSCCRWQCGSATSRACCWSLARWRAPCCTRGRSWAPQRSGW